MHYAVWEGHIGAVKTLLAHGAEAFVSPPDDGYLLRLAAGKKGRIEIVKDLLAAGAINSMNHQANNGMTALHYAARWGHIDIIEALVQAGAKVNLPDNQGQTALHFAAHWGNSQTVRTLIDAGADIYQWDYSGQTVLQEALHWKNYKHLETVNVLSEAAEKNRAESYLLDLTDPLLLQQSNPPPTEKLLAILKNFLEKKQPAILRVITDYPAEIALRSAVIDFMSTHYADQFKCTIDVYRPQAVVVEPVLLVGSMPILILPSHPGKS